MTNYGDSVRFKLADDQTGEWLQDDEAAPYNESRSTGSSDGASHFRANSPDVNNSF